MAEELRAEPIQYNGQVQNTAIGPDRAQSNDDPILCIYVLILKLAKIGKKQSISIENKQINKTKPETRYKHKQTGPAAS